MVLPKKTAANTSATRDYHRTSSIARGAAKPQAAEQTSSLLQFGFTTKPKPCESAAGETPPSKTATPSESSSATPIATQQASAGNGTSPGTNTRAGPDAATNDLAKLSVGDYVIRRNELHIVVGIDDSLTPPSYTVKNEATGAVAETERTLLSLPKPQAAATVTDTRGSSKNTVVRPVSGTDADAVLNGAAAAAMTTTSFVAAIRFPARHIVLQGESRNVYREQQQFFSKDSTAQLIQCHLNRLGRCDSHTLPEEVQAQNAEAQGHADDRQANRQAS